MRLAGGRDLQVTELRISRDPVFSLVFTVEPDTRAIEEISHDPDCYLN